MKTKDELKAMSGADLASYFNGLTGSKVSRFATNTAGVNRIMKAQMDLEDGKKPEVAKPKKAKAPKAAPVVAPTPAAPVDKPATIRASTVYVQEAGQTDWVDYRSVLAAFVALDLPVGVHQGFRKDLKIEGTQTMGDFTFETRDQHNG